MSTDKKDTIEDLGAAVDALAECKEHLEALEGFFGEGDTKEEWQTYRDLQEELPKKQARVKSILKSGDRRGKFSIGEFTFEVRKDREKVVIDLEGLLERAEDREELGELLRYEFIKYIVNVNQLPRLPDKLQVIYGRYITKNIQAGSGAVYLPKNLK